MALGVYRFARWLRTIVFGCLLGWAAASGANTLEIKSVRVDSQLMKFPAIALDNISYPALQFEYASRGDVTVIGVDPVYETITCDGEERSSAYINVRYQGPDVLFRVVDARQNRVLQQRQLDTDGSRSFGRGDCDLTGSAEAVFETQQADWQRDLKRRLLAEARDEMRRFISEDTALSYVDLYFPLYYIVGDERQYNDVNRAFDRARDAFDMYLQYGITEEAHIALLDVVDTWEEALEAIEPARIKNVASERVSLALHRNLSVAYFFINDFHKARRHDAMAISKGMRQSETLQPMILVHERRYILSPKTAKDRVLLANLYRFGRGAIAEAQLQEVAEYSSLTQDLAQQR